MYLQEMLVSNNIYAYIASRQENRQASKQASDHPSKAKQAGAKIMYNTRCYHARCGYRSQHSINACVLACVWTPYYCSRRSYAHGVTTRERS